MFNSHLLSFYNTGLYNFQFKSRFLYATQEQHIGGVLRISEESHTLRKEAAGGAAVDASVSHVVSSTLPFQGENLAPIYCFTLCVKVTEANGGTVWFCL